MSIGNIDSSELRAATARITELESLLSQMTRERREIDGIFRWLLGEEGEFPMSEPGRRYGFRSELRARLNSLAVHAEGVPKALPDSTLKENLPPSSYGTP